MAQSLAIDSIAYSIKLGCHSDASTTYDTRARLYSLFRECHLEW
jgi:hypothetical protein